MFVCWLDFIHERVIFIYSSKFIIIRITYPRGRTFELTILNNFSYGISIDHFNLKLLSIAVFSKLTVGGFFRVSVEDRQYQDLIFFGAFYYSFLGSGRVVNELKLIHSIALVKLCDVIISYYKWLMYNQPVGLCDIVFVVPPLVFLVLCSLPNKTAS